MSLIKLKNNALDNLTSFEGSASLGDMVFISSATASSSASIEFSLGSYKEYKFFFVNMHPSVDSVSFSFNFSTDNGSNYNVIKTSTNFNAQHNEADTEALLTYDAGGDLAQSSAIQKISRGIGNGSDESGSGYLSVFNPSSSTFVKHYIGSMNFYISTNSSANPFVAGYANTTSPLTNIKFQMDSGNIDEGKILMFGIN